LSVSFRSTVEVRPQQQAVVFYFVIRFKSMGRIVLNNSQSHSAPNLLPLQYFTMKSSLKWCNSSPADFVLEAAPT